MLLPGAEPQVRSMNLFSFLLQLFIWRHLTSVLSYHHKLSCISSLRLHPASSCCAISLSPLPHWSRKRKQKGLARSLWAEKQSRHSRSWKASLKLFSSYSLLCHYQFTTSPEHSLFQMQPLEKNISLAQLLGLYNTRPPNFCTLTLCLFWLLWTPCKVLKGI